MQMKSHKPKDLAHHKQLPFACEKVLQWSIDPELYEHISGDCLEGFNNKQSISRSAANVWLYKQILSILWHFCATTQRGTFMFLISFLVLVGVMLMTFLLGGDFRLYINLPSFIIVAVPALIAAIIAVGKKDLLHAFRLLINANMLAQCDNPKPYVKGFDVISKTAMMMGWFGIITGAIAMAGNIKAEEFSSVIGPAFAVLCLTLLYALMIKAFCYLACLYILAERPSLRPEPSHEPSNK